MACGASRLMTDHIADAGKKPLPVERRIEALIDAAINWSPLVEGRHIYVSLHDLYDVVGTIHGLRISAAQARKDAASADAMVCPLALSDPHGACVLSVESERRASDLQADHDKAVMRLSSALVAIERLAGFAGHDHDCTLNRFPNEGICSCGYTSAARACLDVRGEAA